MCSSDLLPVAAPHLAAFGHVLRRSPECGQEEIDNAYQQLKQERLDKIKEKFKETYEPEPKSDIMFRGIPWGTTRSEVEQQIGITSRQSTYLSKLNRVIGEDIGISTSYSTFQLAGYSVSTDVNYVYPIEEGVIIRDADLAMIVFVEYIIFDVSDASKVVRSEEHTSELQSPS